MNQTPQTKTPRWQMLALTCALAIAPSAWAQTKAPAPAETPAKADANKPTPVTTASKNIDDEQVVLSPFVVTTGKDTGYYAANTLAGSRMNTNLADLGAAISVVTKAQMEDFASVDLNDAFRYEVNTEGSGTYTPNISTQKGDGVLDVNAGGTNGGIVAANTNSTANRVRGIGVPSAAINYYPANPSLPPDSYNLQSIEISRGPNSMLFGMGSPAGIANVSTTQASVVKNSNQVQLRTDDRGSFRSSFGFNRVLIKDTLAIYGAMLYDNRQFERKPSYDITQRQYGAITYKPFSKTTIRASVENYMNHNHRPNTVSPVDLVTQWNLAGKPIYDNLTKKVTITSTGQVVGPYISSSSSPNAQLVRNYLLSLPGYNPALRGTSATAFGGTDTTFTFYNGQPIYGGAANLVLSPVISAAAPNPFASPLYVPGLGAYNTRAYMMIANGHLQGWYQPLYNQTYTPGFSTPKGIVNPAIPAPKAVNDPISNIWNNPASADAYDRNAYQSAGWTNNPFVSNMQSYKYPGVTDRAIYDWKKINILQPNYGSQKNRTYNFDVDQEITKDLFFNGGWLRQDFHQSSNYTIAQQFSTAIAIDENKYNPDGTPNPYVGLPFIRDQDPDRYLNNQVDDHFRAMLAYTPDFTKKTGWMKWLGHHQILGLWSRDESMALAIRQRLQYIAAGSPSATYRYLSNPNPDADGNRTGWAFGGSTQRLFYVANPGDPMGVVTKAPGEWNPSTYQGDITVYNYQTNQFEKANVTETYNTGGGSDPFRTQRTVQSYSGGITSYFWADRLTTTFGARLDKVKSRVTTTSQINWPDGTKSPALTPQQKYLPTGYFDTTSMWNRFGPWSRATGRTKTGGGVLRPFKGWSSIESRADSGNQFWQIVRDFGLVYNWSDNFDAPTGPQNDAFGKALANPQGIGHDFGFQFAALDNKFFARVTWFKSTNQNIRQTGANTAISRLTSTTVGDGTSASVDGLFRAWARKIAEINLGYDVISTNPTIPIPADGTPEDLVIRTAAEKIIGQPYSYYENLPGAITATGDAVASGVELQLNYNTAHWRNRVTFGKQDTTNSNVLKEYDAWYAVRSPFWQAAKASTYLLPQYQNMVTYTTAGSTAVDLTTFLTGYGFGGLKNNNSPGTRSPQDFMDVSLTPVVQLAKDLNGQSAPGQRKYRWAYNTGYDFTDGRLKGFGVGGAERWEAKSVIGYYGKPTGANLTNIKLLELSDTTRPIYDKANSYTDLFVKYRRMVANGKVDMTVQLNVENVFEDGHLQTVAVNYDGSPYGYRIIDSRKFTLTTTFNF